MIIEPSKEILGQICEITGVTEALAKSAYLVSDGDIATAVKVLGGSPNMHTNPKRLEALDQQRKQIDGQQQEKPGEQIIEISDDNSDDLARAIALSLEEVKGEVGSAVSVEERDISRALEASLQDQAGSKRKRGGSFLHFADPENPHDRERKDGTPVGLKNVGNTCWFSAVIQSLFHLPKFRQLVLQCKCPEDPDTLKAKPKLAFLAELQKLFTVLLYSRRKYVDPSRAIEILQEAMSGGDNGSAENQQDVSEFTHILFDWLEEAFSDIGSSDGNNENPMRTLFYGKYSVDGLYDGGKRYHTEETFGVIPLHIKGYSNLYDSLDNAMVTGDIDGSTEDTVGCTERWFTVLPTVLPFGLSRFQFNQKTGKTEKIHDEWRFFETIYLSRYIQENKTVARQRMKAVNALKDKRKRFVAKLDKYISFGSGPKKAPIVLTLDAAIDFVNAPTRMDMNCDSPMVVSPQSSPKVSGRSVKKRSKQSSDSIMETADKIDGPSPKSMTNEERNVVENCLRRWRTEAEEEAKALKSGIDAVDEKIRSAYHEDIFKKIPYRLHAILVHEGQASLGHYWAFIYDPTSNKWQKFNDVTVSELTWEELFKESVGGYWDVSAYCLLYVNESRSDIYSPNYKFDPLSKSLRKYLRDHNQDFIREIQEWDRKHNIVTTTCGIDDIDVTAFGAMSAAEVDKSTLTELKFVSPEQDIKINNTLNERLREQLRQIIMVSKVNSPVSVDPRLEHVGVFLVKSKAPDYVTERGMLESYVERENSADEQTAVLKKVAIHRLAELKKKEAQQLEYEEWKRMYNQFLKIRACFIEGALAFYKRKFDTSVPYFAHAYSLNKKACETVSSIVVNTVSVTMDEEFLSYYRRISLKNTNNDALEMFKGTKAELFLEGKTLVLDVVAPLLPQLMHSDSDSDVKASEDLRQKWFDLLSADIIPANRQKHLEEILTKLVQEYCDEVVLAGSPIKLNDLGKKYTKVMQHVMNDKTAPKLT